MALYVRVYTSFWLSRKTARLRAAIGEAALWLPVRLWSYAAEHQPDGDLSNYGAEELALLLGYTSNAQAMLQALQAAGFMDGMRIHDWAEHNSYHSVYAERAKLAARARWACEKEKKQKKQKRREEKKGKEASNASSITCKPLSIQQLTEFCTELGLPETDAQALWAKWEGNGFTNGGRPMKDWKATIRSWKLHGYLASQKNGSHAGPTEEEFCGHFWKADVPPQFDTSDLCADFLRGEHAFHAARGWKGIVDWKALGPQLGLKYAERKARSK